MSKQDIKDIIDLVTMTLLFTSPMWVTWIVRL